MGFWTRMQARWAIFSRGNRILVLYLMKVKPRRWELLALEALAGANPQDVFNDHAHEYLGRYSSMSAATEAAQATGEKWRKRRRKATRCTCEGISHAEGAPL